MLTKIDHLGIAVRDLDESVEYYEKSLGLHCHGREEVRSQKVKTAFFEVGEVHLELLEPTAEDSPIARFLEKNGEGIHHIAFRTDDIATFKARLEEKGIPYSDFGAWAMKGWEQIFFYDPDGNVVEVHQVKE